MKLGDETTAVDDETAAVERAMDQFYTSLNALLAGDARAWTRSGRTPTT